MENKKSNEIEELFSDFKESLEDMEKQRIIDERKQQKEINKIPWKKERTPIQNIRVVMSSNKRRINKEYKYMKVLIEKIFNLEFELNHIYTRILKIRPNVECWADLLASAYQKNLVAIYHSYELTNKGGYNSAAIFFRYIYEFLILSKFCAIANDYSLYERWGEGKQIRMGREIFDRLEKKTNEELYRFYSEMCNFTHPTIASQQPFYFDSKYFDYVGNNYAIILFLLEMNYHMLNSYFVNSSIKYYSEMYSGEEIGRGKEKTDPIKKELKKLFALSKKCLHGNSRKLIYQYKLKWKIKEIKKKNNKIEK